ncbi:MAG: IS21 family transposase [Bacteroidetes bacterium]|nr:MAG: IS21 family transposase [Bacteroidota bacterium]
MYGIEMKITVKTLHERGFSQRAISRELGISRITVNKFLEEIYSTGITPPKIEKDKKLDKYKDQIEEWFQSGLTGVLIQEKLLKEKSFKISYASVSRFLKQFKDPEVYIPLIAKPGEEGQVDFGYLGKFIKDGKTVKVWCFSMVLSYSRYSYHCLVTDQNVDSFIRCHIKSFEYFRAVPQTVKIDNLKAGVITPNFYEPTIQLQYADFLNHYNCAPITARIRRGQDKGKVESGVKYVKNNFLKRIDHKDFYQLEKDLSDWTTNICNKRLHGTTKKIPAEVYLTSEKKQMQALPQKRYELFKIEHRKVNTYGHISYKNNFYSVPYTFIGRTLIIKYNNALLKVYDNAEEIALHQVCNDQGKFITVDAHAPVHKQKKTEQMYREKISELGDQACMFLEKVKNEKPKTWVQIIRGILSLKKNYDKTTINKACKRALEYHVYEYSTVKNICKNGLYDKSKEDLSVNSTIGNSCLLKQYDNLFNNYLNKN